MASKYTPPQITVAYDLEADTHSLMATSHGRTAIAGPRIFRAEPWPSVSWSHETAEGAERDAAILRTYLEECATGKRKDSESVARRKAWWED